MAWTRNRPSGLVYRDAEQSHDGYTLFSNVEGYHATLLDPEGRVVHRWTHEEGVQYAKLLPGGRVLHHTANPVHFIDAEDASPVGVIGGHAHALIEQDWDGNTVWEYRNDQQHHDFVRLDNGNTVILHFELLPDEVRRQVQGGFTGAHDPDAMVGDLVREVSPAGETVREWRSWEHFDYRLDVLCPLERRREWTHANSISVAPDGRWLVSLRQTDTLVIVNPDSGEIEWRWGPGVTSHQHHFNDAAEREPAAVRQRHPPPGRARPLAHPRGGSGDEGDRVAVPGGGAAGVHQLHDERRGAPARTATRSSPRARRAASSR